ncbi:hypothetical protein EN871_18120 [bacterium M00.F.Ca.ET.228.01.1.1]|nr:hypothetical protein EN871_18120 [bacterium M00.F.Ca.ET.228.01.1.1]TGR99032.1 hypothetical protein EN834_20760 [bacterium M00.F.Ca.ET.191.01.1.1]TGU03344.1 hypothetical protein EN798_21580 [bacterium M00.F.Ca.ET.155.01.1.1]
MDATELVKAGATLGASFAGAGVTVGVLLKPLLEFFVKKKLGDVDADRSYRYEARKRLNAAVGPLQFQLLFACRDLCARIEKHGRTGSDVTTLDGYYGQSMLFRILKPLVICELIERQMAFADFGVDEVGAVALRFNKSAILVLSGESVIRNYPNVDWTTQTQHVFYDSVSSATDALIVRDGENERCMRFSEFEKFIKDKENLTRLHPFPRIIDGFKPSEKPIFWIRLVAYGFLCGEFVNKIGPAHKLGFAKRKIDVKQLLAQAADATINENMVAFAEQCESAAAYKL